ncbi:hypothetical protein BGW80DRAFT_1311159, partial [Lactifluus volemus]
MRSAALRHLKDCGMLVGLCVVLIALWPPWIITSRTLFLPHNGFHSTVNENVQHRFEEKFTSIESFITEPDSRAQSI